MAAGALLIRSALPAVLLVTAVGLAVGCSYGPEVRGPFQGQVVDAETGKPLEGVIVLISWPFESGPFKPRDVYDAQETVTDVNGRFELQGLHGTIPWPSVLAPRLYWFLPEYEWTLESEITIPGGRPFLDPTVTRMRRLASRQERCASLDRPGASPLLVDFPKMRRFFDAQNGERLALQCGRLRSRNEESRP